MTSCSSGVSTIQRIGLGGGCHWCTEGVFVSLRGVIEVEQGWIAAPAPDDTFSEAVIVHYDPTTITAGQLMGVHLETHASTKDHGLRYRYRSAIYAFSVVDQLRFAKVLQRLSTEFSEPLVTRVLPFGAFRPSPPKYQDYYRTDPERPFCQTYISPKLRRLRQRRPELLQAAVRDQLSE